MNVVECRDVSHKHHPRYSTRTYGTSTVDSPNGTGLRTNYYLDVNHHESLILFPPNLVLLSFSSTEGKKKIVMYHQKKKKRDEKKRK